MIHSDRAMVSAQAYQEASFRPVPGLNAVSVGMPTAGYSSLVTGTLQAAGAITVSDPTHYLPASSSVTLANTSSSTDGAYVGMAIRITGGTGSGARGTITSYNGTSKVAGVNWGTGASGSAGVPSSLDATSTYDLSVDCFNKGKVVVKVEYGNSSCTAGLRVALRDANGKVVMSQKQTPGNLGITDQATVGNHGEGFEVATDGMDTAYLIVDTAASGGVTPTVTAWAVAV